MAMTAVERVRDQRRRFLSIGWKEVRVWVTNDDEAKKVQEMAAGFRKAFRNTSNLKRVSVYVPDDQEEAIRSHAEKLRKQS